MNKGQNNGGLASRPPVGSDPEANDQGPKLGGYNPIGKGMSGGVIANKKPAPLGVFPVEDSPSKIEQAQGNDPARTGSPLTLRKAQALQRMKEAQACQARSDRWTICVASAPSSRTQKCADTRERSCANQSMDPA